MPFHIASIEKTRAALAHNPERLKAFDKLAAQVEHNLTYAINRTLKTTSWWMKYQGELLGGAKITTDPEIGTACVTADPANGKIYFYFALSFAATLSPGDLAFIIAHECMHFMLRHIPQMKIFNIQYQELWNQCTDAYINEWLLRRLKWTTQAKDPDKLDWITQNGIKWKSLPQEIQDQFPLDTATKHINISCIQIYNAMLKYLAKKGIDPNQFEEAVKNSRMGKHVRRKKRIEENKRGSGQAGETMFQKTYVVPGDLVWVKSKAKYGIIKDLRRTKDQRGEADIDCDASLTREDFRRMNRAIGITTQLGTKNYANSKRIVDAYAKLRQTEQEPGWNELAKATGIAEIAKLAEIDTAQAAYDAETIMTPEEIEAEELAKEQELLRKAQAATAHVGRGFMAKPRGALNV